MHIPKKYFHDRFVLLLLSSSVFLTLLNTALILFRLDSTSGSYIVQYRANLGLSAFQAGGATTFLSFMLFGLVVLTFQIVLSMRIYDVRRQFALVILALGLLLLVLSIIVSNALLALR